MSDRMRCGLPLPFPKADRVDKGVLNGSCNRTACQQPGATWFNTSTRAYYCRSCARDITDFCKRVDGFHICFPTSGDAEVDATWKFKDDPRAALNPEKTHAPD